MDSEINHNSRKELDTDKFKNVLPETISMTFRTRGHPHCFGIPFNDNDFAILHKITGTPYTTNKIYGYEPHDAHYNECFWNLQLDDFIRLVKVFTINFGDESSAPYIEDGWTKYILKNHMTAMVYCSNFNLDAINVSQTLPKFILEAPDTYTKLANKSGHFDLEYPPFPSSWDDNYPRWILKNCQEYIECNITRISEGEERYLLEINSPTQFIRLMKSPFVFLRFNPDTNVSSLIITDTLKRPDT